MKKKITILFAFALIAAFILIGCSSDPSAQEVASKYTDQVAQAIVEGSWKIAGSIFLGLIINGILNN